MFRGQLMWRYIRKQDFLKAKVCQEESGRGIKVSVIGALGNIGQYVSLLLKQSLLFKEVALHDLKSCNGLSLELSQVDTATKISSHDIIKEALRGSSIVITVAGTGSKVGLSDDDFFSMNAKAVVEISKECAKHCPQAFHIIATNPVNSLVPAACEAYKKVLGCVEPGRVFGLTGVNVIRSCSMVSDIAQVPAELVSVPVVGGHSPTTIVPLLSRAEPSINLSTDETVRVTRAVQGASHEKGKEANPSVFGAAYAALKMAEDLAKSLVGQRNVVTCSYIRSNLIPDLMYFASPVELGPTGVQKILPLPQPLSNFECCLLETAVNALRADIKKGISYVRDR